MKRESTAGNTIRSVRILAAVVLAALMTALGAGSVPGSEVFANLKENLDMTKKGSITLSMTNPNSGAGISGISLELIRVASVTQDEDGNYHYVYTDDFKDSTTDLSKLTEEDVGAREAAALMLTHVETGNIHGTTRVTDTEGRVTYTDLDLGVYLIRNYPVSENSESLRPFLVTVPRLLNNEYVYDVDATAKPEAPDIGGDVNPNDQTEKKDDAKDDQKGSSGSSDSSGSSGSSGSDGAGGGSVTSGSRLPQTGQLWWPVPVLVAAGLILIIIGVTRRRSGKKS
ncbi:MAG: hypothetical protein J6S83_02775 [Lachnospiraceae bacterium]|nr:hypothetical protein [Lachnospiraceae bacterium]